VGTFVHKKEVFASHSLFSALKCWCIDSAVEAFESMLVKNMDNLDKWHGNQWKGQRGIGGRLIHAQMQYNS